MSTIFALATAPQPSGVAIIRVSGPDALNSIKILTKNKITSPKPRYLYFTKIVSQDNDTIDNALVTYFEENKSFTGEKVVEFHIHGSNAIIKQLLEELKKIENYRPAEAGEFSRRAFHNNKLSLTEAEAIIDLVNANTILQKRQALKQLNGELDNIYEKWRTSTIETNALLTAIIDFSDEDDIPQNLYSQCYNNVKTIIKEMEKHITKGKKGKLLRNGIKIAIVGSPNVGKSTLINFLTMREVSIVSSIAGTTRDIVETMLDINGYPVILSDTAGIRNNSDDEIEIEGIRRSKEKANNADLKIIIFDASTSPEDIITKEIKENYLILINKTDLKVNDNYQTIIEKYNPIMISLKNSNSNDIIIDAISKKLKDIAGMSNEAHLTQERHQNNIEAALFHLNNFLTKNKEEDMTLAAEDLRLASNSIGNISGHSHIEESLDIIFNKFCIGK